MLKSNYADHFIFSNIQVEDICVGVGIFKDDILIRCMIDNFINYKCGSFLPNGRMYFIARGTVAEY